MNILEIAIQHEKGISNLARVLDVKPNVVSNWKLRGRLSKAWQQALSAKYKRQIKVAMQGGAVGGVRHSDDSPDSSL